MTELLTPNRLLVNYTLKNNVRFGSFAGIPQDDNGYDMSGLNGLQDAVEINSMGISPAAYNPASKQLITRSYLINRNVKCRSSDACEVSDGLNRRAMGSSQSPDSGTTPTG